MKDLNEHDKLVLSGMCDKLHADIIEAAEGYMAHSTYANLKIYRKLLEAYEETHEYKHGYNYKHDGAVMAVK